MTKHKKEGEVAEETKVAVVVPETAVSEYNEQKASVEKMILVAVEKGLPIETMERILAMRTQLKAERAKELFDSAMAKFQGDCPVIAKRKQGNNYKYAPLDDIVGQVRQLLKECGFSYRIEAEMKDDTVTATCIAIHRDGHSEKSSFTAKVEKVVSRAGSTVRTAMQDSAASLTFAKRYAFCNAFGIMTGDEDTEKTVKEAPADQVEMAMRALDKCTTVEALKKTWGAFSKEVKATREVIVKANEMKNLIEDAKNKGV